MKVVGFMSPEEIWPLKKLHTICEIDSLSDHDLDLAVEYLFDPEGFAEFHGQDEAERCSAIAELIMSVSKANPQ